MRPTCKICLSDALSVPSLALFNPPTSFPHQLMKTNLARFDNSSPVVTLKYPNPLSSAVKEN